MKNTSAAGMDKPDKSITLKYLAWTWWAACSLWSVLLFARPVFAVYTLAGICVVNLVLISVTVAQKFGIFAKIMKPANQNRDNKLYDALADRWHMELTITLAELVRTLIWGITIVSAAMLIFVWRYLDQSPVQSNTATPQPTVLSAPVVLLAPPTFISAPTLLPVAVVTTTVIVMPTIAPVVVLISTPTTVPQPATTRTPPTVSAVTAQPLGPTPVASTYDSFLQSIVPRIALVEVITSSAVSSSGYITLGNFGSTEDLSGWRINDNMGNEYVFESFVFAAKSTIRVHFVSGADTSTDLFWKHKYHTGVVGQPNQWTLIDNAGATVDVYRR